MNGTSSLERSLVRLSCIQQMHITLCWSRWNWWYWTLMWCQMDNSPILVMLLAIQDTTIDLVSVNDNGFGSWITLGSARKCPWRDSSRIQKQKYPYGKRWCCKAKAYEWETQSAYYSFDAGVSWSEVGDYDYSLPAEFSSAPLKFGYLAKKEWKRSYRFETSFFINNSPSPPTRCGLRESTY